MVRIVSHKQRVMAKLEAAFEKAAEAYGDELKSVIRNPYPWSANFGTTRRRNGEVVVGGYRDIYDLGNLYRSQEEEKISAFRYRFRWDGMGKTPVPIVHEGAVLRNGGRIPPRRFTYVAARQANLPQRFAYAFKEMS